VASTLSNAEAAPAVVQFIRFPMIFLSGTYFPIHSTVLNDIAAVLPLRPSPGLGFDRNIRCGQTFPLGPPSGMTTVPPGWRARVLADRRVGRGVASHWPLA
jgi:hypothetical protein